MSIQGEIDRLSAAKASIAASLQAMGIEPPEGTTLEQYAAQLAAIATAAPWLSIPGGGTMQMGESLGEGPYTIEVTEDGEGGGISAEQVGYSNMGSGLEATNIQEAIDELAGKGGGEYLPLTGGTMQGDITIPADKAIKHGGSAAQIKMMPNGNIRIEAPLAEGAAAITVGTSGINLVNNTTRVLQTSESGVALKANMDMTWHKIANLVAPSDSTDAANKQYVDEHTIMSPVGASTGSVTLPFTPDAVWVVCGYSATNVGAKSSMLYPNIDVYIQVDFGSSNVDVFTWDGNTKISASGKYPYRYVALKFGGVAS